MNTQDNEDNEILEYIKLTSKLLKRKRLLLDDNDPRFLLEEGENTYEYKY